MLVNIHRDTAREHRRLLVAGVAFVAVIALLVWLSVAIYTKTFDRVTTVTVKADRAGLQLAKFGDVRLNGALVGRVDAIEQDGKQASITLALEPDAAERMPANLSVEILPTTLFGQKFVSLVPPTRAEGRLRDGDVIPAGRVRTNVELSQVLADLFPLLRAVRPADLNATLSAIATALSGRGDDLGETLDKLGRYVGEIDQSLPTLREDLVALADVADTYELAAPDLLDVLDDVTVTSKTITEKAADLDVFFSDVAGLARTTTRVLSRNEQNLIRVGEVTRPLVALLAEYSPEFPCLIRGAANYEPILSKTFEGNVVKQYIEFFQPQTRAFDQRDLPEYGEVGHGPWCAGLPGFTIPTPGYSLDQGSDIDEKGGTLPIPNLGLFDPISSIDSGYAGSRAEQALVGAMLSSRSGRRPTAYGALGPLLYGPVVRAGGVEQ